MLPMFNASVHLADYADGRSGYKLRGYSYAISSIKYLDNETVMVQAVHQITKAQLRHNKNHESCSFDQ